MAFIPVFEVRDGVCPLRLLLLFIVTLRVRVRIRAETRVGLYRGTQANEKR